MGEELPPLAFTGIGMGKFLSHGDGDGKLSPDGEFPVDILNLYGCSHKLLGKIFY